MRPFILCTLLVLLAAASAAEAQPVITLSGTVTDDSDEPLPGVHVFLAGTTRGTVTDLHGAYRIAGIPPGAHRLVASMVGYETAAHDLMLRPSEEREVDITLEERVYDMGEARVEAPADRRWQRRLQRFEEVIFGASTFADSVRLLNPEVLDFRARFGVLYATAREPLLIENRALGYRLRYDLTVFEASSRRIRYDGEPLFEELTPADSAEAARWAEARRVAYAGSLPHLLRSLLAGTSEAEGFTLRHRPDEGPRALGMRMPSGLPPRSRLVGTERLLRPGPHPDERVLRFAGFLEIIYSGEPEDEGFLDWEWNHERLARTRPDQHSMIYLDPASVIIDARGEPADPFAIVRMGYLAFRRLSMFLPVEYGLEGN